MSSRSTPLPGFRLALGITVVYTGLVVLLPLLALLLRSATIPPAAFWEAVSSPRALSSFRLSLTASLSAAAVNAVFGTLLAWVLVRYRFPGRSLVDALVDLPFALPTAVAGLTLTALLAPSGLLGAPLSTVGVKVAFAPLGVVVALTFIGLPFVVRTVQPVLAELDPRAEEAALVLGASRWQTFWRVLLPGVLPAVLTGFTLAFARAIGEYGSIVFISGNLPLKTEITPFLIVTKLEQYDYDGATALAVVLLLASFALLLSVNLLHRWGARRLGTEVR